MNDLDVMNSWTYQDGISIPKVLYEQSCKWLDEFLSEEIEQRLDRLSGEPICWSQPTTDLEHYGVRFKEDSFAILDIHLESQDTLIFSFRFDIQIEITGESHFYGFRDDGEVPTMSGKVYMNYEDCFMQASLSLGHLETIKFHFYNFRYKSTNVRESDEYYE